MQLQPYMMNNWIDGMKVNKTHFIAQDNAHIYQLAQNTSSLLHDQNYGLLPDHQHNGPGVKLFLSADNQQQVQLRIHRCRAITRGGYFFQFEEETALNENKFQSPLPFLSVPFRELKVKASLFYIVISVSPYERIPFGMADPDEVPPRAPYSVPAFNLSLLPEQDVVKNSIGLFQIPVGKLKIEDQKVLLDEEYIPPCNSISSHIELLELHAGIEQFYSKIETYGLQIIQKILQRKQSNEMAIIIQKLCEQLIIFTASQLAEIKSLSLYQPPVYLITKVCSLARLFKNILDCYIDNGKDGLMNYCFECCGISQLELENSITDLSNHQYDHLDINKSIKKVLHFAKTISTLFSSLAKLEYIGKRKDPGIFVKENIVTYEPEVPVKTRRSFLAD